MHEAQRSHSHLAVHLVKDHVSGVQQHLAGGHGGGEADLVIQLPLQLRHQLNGGEVRPFEENSRVWTGGARAVVYYVLTPPEQGGRGPRGKSRARCIAGWVRRLAASPCRA